MRTMQRVGVLCGILILAAGGGAMAAVWEESELGRTAIFQMQNAPYPHESRSEGFKNNDKLFPRDPHYVDNSVALFIPKGFRPGKRVNLLFYFHGHSNNVRTSLDQYRLREQIVASGKNIILVFPEGPKDAGDSGGGKLEEAGGLKRLVDEVLEVLLSEGKIASKDLGDIVLSGHSGAYRVISYCVEHGGLEDPLSEVYLLDASYARLEQFVDWVVRNRRGRFLSIFTDHLAGENVFLMTEMAKRGVRYALLQDEDASDAFLRRNRVIFLPTFQLDHNGTVTWLERCLRTSRLSDK